MINPQVQALAAHFARMDKRITQLERNQRASMGPVSVAAGALTFTDAAGNPQMIVGQQGDGTYTTVSVTPQAPAVPDQPLAGPGILGIWVYWDGLMADGSSPRADFAAVQVHCSAQPGFTPSAATLQGTMSAAGLFGVGNLAADVTYYACLVAVNEAGNASGPGEFAQATAQSVPASIPPGSLSGLAIQTGTLTAAQLAEEAGILGSQIASNTITDSNLKAGTITANSIASNTLTAAQIVAGIVIAGVVDGTAIEAATFIGSVFEGLNFTLSTAGLFFYSGTPATGNLIISIATAAGTDGQGNSYPQGVYVAPGAGSVDGSVIDDGTLPASSAAFQATDIGGITVFSPQSPAPTASNIGDLWFDSANGNLLNQWDGASWDPYQWGTNAVAAGSVTADLIAAGAIVAGMIAAGAIDGLTINGVTINGDTVSAADVLVSGTNGGVFAYGSGGTIVRTFSSSGTWTAPAGVTSVKAETWGGGAAGATGSNSTGGGGGGGGGEYAAETTLAVTPGNNYTVTVGAAGANSTFPGDSVTVTAHGGSAGSGGTGGNGGSGSTNTTHHNGGKGGNGSGGTVTTQSLTGSGNWTCPAGVTSVKVQCYGPGSGGDGGGLAGGANSGGYGGAGGAYASSTVSVTPGNNYAYSCGSGGSGGSPNHNGSSGSGPTTWNSGQVSADYGRMSGGGISTPGFAVNSTGSVKESGGYGGSASGSGGAGGGSSAGSSAFGNNGQSVSGSSGGSGGSAPSGGYVGGTGGSANNNGGGGNFAGGGGGGGGGASAGTGGAGGDGIIKITYTLPSNAGGGGGGGSAGTSAAGGTGSAGTGGAGGAGASAVSGGGPGGSGGNDNATGSAPSATPGGGGGGGGAAVAGGAGKAGQVRLTYTSGTPTLVASMAGASGTDPEAGATVPAGYMGPVVAIEPGSSPETPAVWHPITLDSGWSTVSGFDAPRYRLLPDGNLQLSGAAQRTAFTSNTNLNNSNPLPSAYQPVNTHHYRASDTSTATGRPGVQISSAGVIEALTNGVSQTVIEIDGIIPLN